MVVAAAEPVAVSQCNGEDNVGGQAVECHVTVVNNLDQATGETSSTVTVQECHGAAGAAICGEPTTTAHDGLTTSVDQCNGSGNGGGGTVTCDVEIVNNITGTASPTPVTVNQCNESGTGGGTEPTTACNPFPANTTDATITQCNGSGTGGGGTERVRCTVEPGSTETSALPVNVDQCNGSGNGGGGTVTCTVKVTNNIIPAEEPPPVEPPPTPELPTPELPTADQPTADLPTADQPTADQPLSDQPLSEHPSPDQPLSEQPSSEQPATGQPVLAAAAPAATSGEPVAATESTGPVVHALAAPGQEASATTTGRALPTVALPTTVSAERANIGTPGALTALPTLAATGAATQWQLSVAGLAIALGGVMVTVSLTQRRRRDQNSVMSS